MKITQPNDVACREMQFNLYCQTKNFGIKNIGIKKNSICWYKIYCYKKITNCAASLH